LQQSQQILGGRNLPFGLVAGWDCALLIELRSIALALSGRVRDVSTVDRNHVSSETLICKGPSGEYIKTVDGDLAVRKDCHHDMHVVQQANMYTLPTATGQTLSYAKIKPIAWVICENGTNRRNIAPLLPIILTPKQTVAALGTKFVTKTVACVAMIFRPEDAVKHCKGITKTHRYL
jgi:hypothetical protein